MVTILATTALRISEVSGLRVGDVNLGPGPLHVFRQTYPGRGGLVTKQTKGRRRRTVPIIDLLRHPAVTSRYLHPDTQAVLDAGTAFSAWWSGTGPESLRSGLSWVAGAGHENGP
jgi:integrase